VNIRIGNIGNRKVGKTLRKMDGLRRNTTNRGLTEGGTRDRDRRRSLVLGEGKKIHIGEILGKILNE
jgi:hypothetical protein